VIVEPSPEESHGKKRAAAGELSRAAACETLADGQSSRRAAVRVSFSHFYYHSSEDFFSHLLELNGFYGAM